MFARSFSIEVGAVVVDAVDIVGVTVDMLEEGRGVGEHLGDDAREVGTNELVGLDGVVTFRAGPITYSKLRCYVRRSWTRMCCRVIISAFVCAAR
jgi:hypothetical protein